ncbi:hypothetical protein BS50DRAFT_658857, partial [Corynespora cassiicola Philippines]
MRHATIILSLFIALPMVHATSSLNPFRRRDTCNDGEEICDEAYCMPAGSYCCDSGIGSYCDAGQYCSDNACYFNESIHIESTPPTETTMFQDDSGESTPTPIPTERPGRTTTRAL